MKNVFKISLIALLTVTLFACNNDDDNSNPIDPGTDVSIAEFVANNDDYSSLEAALEAAGLTETLSAGEFTVFAPNNAAFEAFLNAQGFAALGDVPVDVLTNILLNHVVAGTNESSDLITGYVSSLATEATSGANLSLFINTASGVNVNGVSNVTTADIAASNGVIHAVDAVIGVANVTTQAIANPDFSILVDALIAASDTDLDYVALLSGSTSAPFTVFAPTNEAFVDLLNALGFASLDDVPQSALRTILNYHVLASANVRSGDLEDGQTPTTFEGSTFEISLDAGAQVIDATGVPSNIIAVDVQTGNGVIHAVDKVLLPMAIADGAAPTLTGLAYTNPALTSLFAALKITGLDAVLADPSADFTVFAPTNDSFAAFLDAAGFNNIDEVPVEVLTQVVLNHAISGSLFAADLTTSYGNTLATFGDTDANLSIYINTDSGVTLNGQSSVIIPDVTATNGVAHVVDAVIGLPTVVTFATADATFGTLVAALTRDDQPDFVSVLSTGNGAEPAPFTVFAPTNDAFGDLLTELGASSLDDIDGATLTATLNTHVIAGANVRAEDLVSGSVGTLGADIEIDASNATITDLNGRVINIIVTNVQAANGVVHAINRVILPEL
ncbi:fasciclin domain-containing protein [Gilvibacter sp.]|uniref:fasciclin domain-containing protein n=1 Tax=Gilvibacter sp. TaxID=2729997 RepID=UPI0025BA65CE|nr:fasciclin domain-containing protein [Gilvibacter sp.]NQX77913.1 fasciclin domain-containing protein [Gilvibacter sp.]